MNVTNGTILKLKNYRVLSLKPSDAHDIPELERALNDGASAQPDSDRDGFYVVELESSRAYVYVLDKLQTVYLVASQLVASSRKND